MGVNSKVDTSSVPATINLAVNPRVYVGVTGWTGSGGTGTSVRTTQAGTAVPFGTFFRRTFTATSSVARLTYVNATSGVYGIHVVAGKTYSVAMFVRSSIAL